MPRDAVALWLESLIRAMRLPRREAIEIRDELEGHLRERVRDLMLAGRDEPEAVHAAIRELGDAALLAQRYQAASRPRRTMMKVGAIAVVALAGGLILSNLAPSLGGGWTVAGPRGSVFPADQASVADPLAEIRVSGTIEDTTLEHALEFLATAADRTLYVHWSELEDWGIDREIEIARVPLPDLSLADALDLINSEIRSDNALAARARGRLLEISTQEAFDARDRQLVAYDLSEAIEAGVDPHDVSISLMNLVEPDHWADNGGSIATASALGTKLFVSAPPRMHARIAWVLEQLTDDRESATDPRGASPRAALETRLVPLANAAAAEVATTIDHLLTPADGLERVSIAADPRSNTLIMTGPGDAIVRAKELVLVLDQPTQRRDADPSAKHEISLLRDRLATACSRQMRLIGALMITYAIDGDRWPERPSDLRTLAESQGLGFDIFIAPSDLSPEIIDDMNGHADGWAWADAHSSFEMCPGELYRSDSPILLEKTPVLPDRRLICFGDGHVEIVAAGAR
ncbi:MAG: hypothetical protein H6811_03910 [Phycisphaeraceae bacterium]|nr:hypothetical protein [Phycisphaeraceae bacterium]